MRKLCHGQPITAGAEESTLLWFSDRREEAVQADPQIGWLEYDADLQRRLWRKFRARVLEKWAKEYPGTRPSTWWQQEAPRSPRGTYPDCYYDGTLPEPRKQLSGAGVPAFQCKNLVPAFDYGIPTDWAHFNLADPAVFESQAAYLRRHELLTASERRLLSPEDFESELMTAEDFRHWDSRPWREVVREQILARVAAGEETAERAAQLLSELRQ